MRPARTSRRNVESNFAGDVVGNRKYEVGQGGYGRSLRGSSVRIGEQSARNTTSARRYTIYECDFPEDGRATVRGGSSPPELPQPQFPHLQLFRETDHDKRELRLNKLTPAGTFPWANVCSVAECLFGRASTRASPLNTHRCVQRDFRPNFPRKARVSSSHRRDYRPHCHKVHRWFVAVAIRLNYSCDDVAA